MQDLFLTEPAAGIEGALLSLAADGAVREEAPEAERLACEYLAAKEGKDTFARETALINLYLRLHSAGCGYSSSERELLNKRAGISCQPGGLTPLVMAERLVKPGSTVADLGAGNGLQGLLLQRIRPHRKTLQIELSSEMVRVGLLFQRALGISDSLVEWINRDIADVPLEEVDFVYLYRPARPHGRGNELYRAVASRLAAVEKPLVVLSVADCFAKFLDKRFSVFYSNEHIACLYKE
jgi:hypothetical protein